MCWKRLKRMGEPLNLTGVHPPDTSGVPEQKPDFLERPGSPDENCPICLEELQNRSYTDSCHHQFCFHCLKEWSKVKPECPLCKQIFRIIIHNIRSAGDYDEHRVDTQSIPSVSFENTLLINLAFERRGYRFRTTVGGDNSFSRQYYDDMADVFRQGLPFQHSIPAPRSTNFRFNNTWREFGDPEFRRQIYCLGLWTRVESARRRESSPEFYRNNPAQTYRLVPWLNRELHALLPNSTEIHRITHEIMALLEVYPINSRRFADSVRPYFNARTSHFCYELYSFATSPFDMVTHDTNATLHTYSSIHQFNETNGPTAGDVAPFRPSSSSSSDSDVEVIQVMQPNQPSAPPSILRSLDLTMSRTEPPPTHTSREPIPLIEISDSDDSDRDDVLNVEDNSDTSSVEIIASFPPNRTPEVITLDSDEEVTVEAVTKEEASGSGGSVEDEAVASTSRGDSWCGRYHWYSSSDSQVESSHDRRKRKKSKSKKKSSKKKSSRRKRSYSSDSSSSYSKTHKKRIKKEYTIAPVKEECDVKDEQQEGGERCRPRLRSIVRVVSPRMCSVRHYGDNSSESDSDIENCPVTRRYLASAAHPPSSDSDY